LRILIAATRRIHTAAVSLHILALRIGVYASDRTVKAAMAVTDAAHFAVGVANAALEEAKIGAEEAHKLELTVIRQNATFRGAAQLEADSLRRGVTL
jgi:hypothetical protein